MVPVSPYCVPIFSYTDTLIPRPHLQHTLTLPYPAHLHHFCCPSKSNYFLSYLAGPLFELHSCLCFNFCERPAHFLSGVVGFTPNLPPTSHHSGSWLLLLFHGSFILRASCPSAAPTRSIYIFLSVKSTRRRIVVSYDLSVTQLQASVRTGAETTISAKLREIVH